MTKVASRDDVGSDLAAALDLGPIYIRMHPLRFPTGLLPADYCQLELVLRPAGKDFGDGLETGQLAHRQGFDSKNERIGAQALLPAWEAGSNATYQQVAIFPTWTKPAKIGQFLMSSDLETLNGNLTETDMRGFPRKLQLSSPYKKERNGTKWVRCACHLPSFSFRRLGAKRP